MTYQLDGKIKVKDVKPVLGGFLQEALQILRENDLHDEDTVHDIRVLMKKSRAIHKLVSGQTGKVFYERNLEACRETGRILSLLRETSVQRKTVRQLRKNNPDLFRRLKDSNIPESVFQKPVNVKNAETDLQADLENMKSLLEKASYRLRFEPMSALSPTLLYVELEKSYDEVAVLYLKCRNNAKPKLLHEFRKRAKDFMYQLALFRQLNPSLVRSIEKKLDAMTQNLGRYRDYNQVIKFLDYKYSPGAFSHDLDELVVIIREKEDRCLAKVWPVAHVAFKPGMRLFELLGFRMLYLETKQVHSKK